MLTSIRKSDLTKVEAREVARSDAPFMCPICQSETILHKGMIKIPHFAHKPPVFCEYGKGESEQHRRCKDAIYTELSKYQNISCELEKNLGVVVPDIYIEQQNPTIKVAIEVQISSLTMERIIARTQAYYQLGIHVLWLALYDAKLEDEKYVPKTWEKWLHMTYFGRVYYWKEGLSVLPVHFGKYQLYVPESHWYEDGEEQWAGGYERTSKRYRKPLKGPLINVVTDFRVDMRPGYAGGKITVPDCKLLVDTLPRWW